MFGSSLALLISTFIGGYFGVEAFCLGLYSLELEKFTPSKTFKSSISELVLLEELVLFEEFYYFSLLIERGVLIYFNDLTLGFFYIFILIYSLDSFISYLIGLLIYFSYWVSA